MSNLKNREDTYQQNKKHLDDIRDGKIPPDEVIVEKQSIYAEWLERAYDDPAEPFSQKMEKEIHRNITAFSPKVATKRIMELIWITRYEW